MTGQQIEALRAALCSAFNQDTLDEMLRLRLDKSRLELAGSGNLRTVVFNLIEAAVREGWSAQLIRAAISFNPGNPSLQRFTEEYPDTIAEGDVLVSATSTGTDSANAPPPTASPVFDANRPETASRTVGKYELVRFLWRTGSGRTWLARDTVLAHDVILKSYSFAGFDRDRLSRVAAQVMQRARLCHPALVTPIDVVPLNENLFVVTPFRPNVKHLPEYLWRKIQLLKWVRQKTAYHILSQVALGLSHAHALGVSHQSLVPWDIQVDRSARVWVAGFERAVVYEYYGGRHGEGTLRYFSPEMLRGEPLDARTDVYHVGIILLELATGLPLFNYGPTGYFDRSLDDARSVKVETDRIADRKLRATCLKCLQPQKQDRFVDAGELYRALQSPSGKKHWWQVWK